MSMITKDICELSRNRRSPEELLAGLLDTDSYRSKAAGMKLCQDAKDYGLNMSDYLKLAIDTNKSEHADRYKTGQGMYLNGEEAAFAYLGLPVKNDLSNGTLLQAAANTFSTYDGTRAMFPPVIDMVLRWQNHINMIETTAPMLASSRTISGNEMVQVVILDDSPNRLSNPIAEGANIPVSTVQMTEQAVKMYKHGSGYQFTYEFQRRAALDILTPFAARVARQLELSKVLAATNVLVNGDGVQAAAVVQKSSTFTPVGYSYTPNASIQYKPLMNWLVDRARRMVPVDTVIGNYQSYTDWLLMYSPVTSAGLISEAKAMQDLGVSPDLIGDIPMLMKPVKFVLSSGMPNGQLIGLTKAECLEELIEAGSQIVESERAVQSQTFTYLKSEVTGYKLIFADTREIIDFTQ